MGLWSFKGTAMTGGAGTLHIWINLCRRFNLFIRLLTTPNFWLQELFINRFTQEILIEVIVLSRICFSLSDNFLIDWWHSARLIQILNRHSLSEYPLASRRFLRPYPKLPNRFHILLLKRIANPLIVLLICRFSAFLGMNFVRIIINWWYDCDIACKPHLIISLCRNSPLAATLSVTCRFQCPPVIWGWSSSTLHVADALFLEFHDFYRSAHYVLAQYNIGPRFIKGAIEQSEILKKRFFSKRSL